MRGKNRDEDVEAIRERIGFDYHRDGTELHESASDAFRSGHSFAGSNVMPPKFGQTGDPHPDWICVCGCVNKGNVRRMIANRVVCWDCGLEQEIAQKVEESE